MKRELQRIERTSLQGSHPSSMQRTSKKQVSLLLLRICLSSVLTCSTVDSNYTALNDSGSVYFALCSAKLRNKLLRVSALLHFFFRFCSITARLDRPEGV